MDWFNPNQVAQELEINPSQLYQANLNKMNAYKWRELLYALISSNRVENSPHL